MCTGVAFVPKNEFLVKSIWGLWSYAISGNDHKGEIGKELYSTRDGCKLVSHRGSGLLSKS